MREEPQTDAFDSDETDAALRAELSELSEAEASAKARIRTPYGKENIVLEPLQDRVVLRVKDRPSRNTIGTLVLPEKHVIEIHIGEVVAVGPGAIRKKDGARMPLVLGIGDEVIYHEFGGQGVEFGEVGEYRYRVIRERDCLALITND